MSRFWPHSAYAEDQPYSHAILYTHVLTRGAQAGSIIGTGVGGAVYLLRQWRVLKPNPSTLTATVLRSTGVGAVVGTGLLAIGLPVQMRGKEEIEWADRSWRLLENKGQVECDDWTYALMAAGLASSLTASKSSLGWRGVAGRTGAGSIAGMLGYMGWRYGIHGGKHGEISL
ncbi:hypothetical protein BP5796_10858 [Coleophoma crateriformis]|uniref:Uncharacterized protein n=1 Tax=Coleophoma crateriformis TaxID=565419 RepID=A0A3D8QL51_9HELO|nr:hypothetical protein BP5796_10858 [Coleophoma crateriformis]